MIDSVYNISPQQINYILELSIEKSFMRASEKCFVTQPTLSMQIKKVEEIIGFVIFDRSRTPLELTSFGEKLIPILKDIQTEYARITALTKQSKGTFVEQIKLGIIPTISAYLISDIFDTLKTKLKNVQLKIEELKTEELIEAMKDGKLDMAILAGPYLEPRMRTIPLYKEEINLYFPSGKSNVVNPNELEGVQPWLLSKGNCLRTQMVHFCGLNEEESFETSWNYEGGNIDLLMKMVDLNGGYTLIPANYKVDKKYLKRLYDNSFHQYPAREIISVIPTKTLKKESCERIIRIIQHQYNSESGDDLKVLNWK